MADVFISYSRDNQTAVKRIADGVTAAGYDIWWDEHLPAHRSYGDVITEKIAGSSAVIVVWSASAVASEWVRAEADMARNQRKLVQAALDDVMPPLPFNQIQYASLGDWNGEAGHPGWQKILASLAELTGAPRPPVDPVAAPVAAPTPPSAPPPTPQHDRLKPALGVALALIVLAGALWFFTMRRDDPADPAAVITPTQSPATIEPAPSATQAVEIPASSGLPPASMVGSGEIVPPEADVAPPSGEPRLLFPYASEQLLTIADIDPLSVAQLGMARNELLARAGHRFSNPALDVWFRRFDWYHPKDAPAVLDSIQRANMSVLVEEENTR